MSKEIQTINGVLIKVGQVYETNDGSLVQILTTNIEIGDFETLARDVKTQELILMMAGRPSTGLWDHPQAIIKIFSQL